MAVLVCIDTNTYTAIKTHFKNFDENTEVKNFITVPELLKAAHTYAEKRIVIFFESSMLDHVYNSAKKIKCYDARPILVSLKHMLSENGRYSNRNLSRKDKKSKPDFKIQKCIKRREIWKVIKKVMDANYSPRGDETNLLRAEFRSQSLINMPFSSEESQKVAKAGMENVGVKSSHSQNQLPYFSTQTFELPSKLNLSELDKERREEGS